MINRDTDMAMFEALFVRVKEVFLKPFLLISATFLKSADIYTVITQSD